MLFVLKNILTQLQRHLVSLKVNMQIDIGEKILQRFHKLLIAVYFWLIPRDLTGRGNSTYKNNQKNSI